MIQLSFAYLHSEGELDSLLTAFREEVEAQLVLTQDQVQPFPAQTAVSPRLALLRDMIRQSWIRYYQSELDWVLECLAGLQTLDKTHE